ncbi:MAG: glycosyltransferase family 4 protein [Aestuariivirga sp.]
MRIVFVQAGLTAGGAEKVVNVLARHNAGLGNEVFVIAFSGSPGQSYFAYPDSVRIITMEGEPERTHGRLRSAFARTAWLARQFRALKPDVAVSFLTKTNVMSMAAGLVTGVPVVISERNNPTKRAASPLWLRAINVFGRQATAIVMQTDASQQILASALRKKAVVIPNPAVLPEGVTFSSGDGQRIVAVGRLEPQKGFDLLIRAFAQVGKDLSKASLTIFGEGPDLADLQALAQELDIADRLNFAGLSATPGMWLAEGDIFVLSSRFEGFPNVLVEALAGGLASIAFDCPWGPSDIIMSGENGLLVPQENVPALAQAIRKLLTDPDLRLKLAKAGPPTATRFSLDSVLAKWDFVIKKATAGRGALA